MKQTLSLRVSQHLALTPQLQQSIKLLQLSTLELGQEIEQMLDDNPFLERTPDDIDAGAEENSLNNAIDLGANNVGGTGATGQNDEKNHENNLQNGPEDTPEPAPDWEGDGTVELSPDDSEWGGDAPARTHNAASNDGEADAADLAHSHESLTAFLHRQALALRLSDVGRAALYFLIESLNDDGYLEDSLEDLAIGLAAKNHTEEVEELIHHFTVALHLLQNLEPTGVGARHLAECLTLQLKAQMLSQRPTSPHLETLKTALHICQQPLELLARRDVRRLVPLCGASEEATRAAMTLIARLEPRPGRRFVNVERNTIVPDVLVRRTHLGQGGYQFSVQLNLDVMPRLRVHDVYASALRGHKGDGNHPALQQRLQEARWFIKNIQQRFDTILRVSRAIVERQKNFFVHGALAMRPLVLRDIADELGLHESTISRVTTAKYMATPQGTYELKYFFGSGLGTDTGGNASSTAVRALIKQFIAAENPAKPFSDSQLAEMLKEQGIECARRTVAKYREGLKIPTATLRKAL